MPRIWSVHPNVDGRKYVVASNTHNQIHWDVAAGVCRLFTRHIYEALPARGDRKISCGSRTMTNLRAQTSGGNKP